jgi:hypothetical protein
MKAKLATICGLLFLCLTLTPFVVAQCTDCNQQTHFCVPLPKALVTVTACHLFKTACASATLQDRADRTKYARSHHPLPYRQS